MKVLIVGVGSIGMRHLQNLLGLRDRFDLHLEATDPDVVNRQRAGKLLGGRVYSGMEEALEIVSYDTVIICSPNRHHISQAILALSHGCHVFIEKPLSIDLVEAEQFVSAAHVGTAKVMVGCNLRFHCAVRTIQDVLRNGAVGKPLYAKAHFAHYLPNWRPGTDYRVTYSARKDEGGGILLDAVHEPDYLCWLFGPALDVQGRLMNLGELEMDCEDTAIFVISHESGVVSEVHVDYLRRDKSRECVVVGTKGTIVWESTDKNPEKVLVKLFDAERHKWSVVCDVPEYDLNTQYIDEMVFFLSAASNDKILMNEPKEAFQVMNLLDAVRKSSKTARRVRLTMREKA